MRYNAQDVDGTPRRTCHVPVLFRMYRYRGVIIYMLPPGIKSNRLGLRKVEVKCSNPQPVRVKILTIIVRPSTSLHGFSVTACHHRSHVRQNASIFLGLRPYETAWNKRLLIARATESKYRTSRVRQLSAVREQARGRNFGNCGEIAKKWTRDGIHTWIESGYCAM